MLRGACVRHAARCVGGLRSVLGHGSGGSLPLPEAEAPSTVARLVIHIGPEPRQWDSGSIALRVGGSQEWAVALLRVHTPSKIRVQFQD
jgi:hypothetical protein